MCASGGAAATVDSLLADVYGQLPTCTNLSEFIIERAILTPLNDDVDMLNDKVMDTFPQLAADGSPAVNTTNTSADSVEDVEYAGMYPVEFLNSLKFSGMPPHVLRLQVGCPVVLMRNMSGGLANGTRLIVKRLSERVIEAVVATGPGKSRVAFLPRINLKPSDDGLMPFTLVRRQFPVRAAYAMTINKAQGQTFKSVGVYLPKPVFTHGQLYVAFSRMMHRRQSRCLSRGVGARLARACRRGATPAMLFTQRRLNDWWSGGLWGCCGVTAQLLCWRCAARAARSLRRLSQIEKPAAGRCAAHL
jgi:ATP-dependent DNA helicase PIF1